VTDPDMSAAKAPDRRRVRSAPRYRTLIDVSTELFSRQGYEATTIRQIADKMGIKSASLYSHVGSKGEILREVVLDIAHEFDESALDAVRAATDPEQRLYTLCRTHMRVMDSRADAVRVYYEQWRKLNDDYQREIIRLRDGYEKLFHTTLTDGVAEKIYRPIDVAHTVRVLLGALNWTNQWRTPGHGDPEAMADQIVDTILHGIRAPGH
jgi:TetR/AcrR family transcriptional regulator, cholesterol catabolism regulator